MTDDAVTVRPLSADRFHDFTAITDYAFDPDSGPRDYEETPERIADRYGAFADGDFVSVCAHYDFRTYLRGEWVPLAGLAAVATPPEHRREGYVSALVADFLERSRGEAPLSALWPFEHAYYAQFGWATATTFARYTCAPGDLAFARGTADGHARQADPDEWRDLRTVQKAAAERTSLAVRRRAEAFWRERVFRVDADERPWVYVWERDGEPRGYLVYTFEDQGGPKHMNKRLKVSDMAAADHDAWLGLLGFLADHDSQASEVVLYAGDRTDLLDLAPHPAEIDCELLTGPMVRVVDVVDALEACPYPDDASADLRIDVTDGTADWNDGRFRLTVADGEGRCERTDPEGDTDATVDVGTLSQLVAGYHDVATTRRVGDLSVADETVAETLDDLFPGETTALSTFF